MGKYIITFAFLLLSINIYAQSRVREAGLQPGVLPAGKYNSITDVPDVRVGHKTLISGDSDRTGVTVILPHAGNLFRQKVPAAIHIGNGFGKLAGYTQVKELGTLETPIALTNTLSVFNVANGLIQYTLYENKNVRSVNPVVGETNDGYLNDIRKQNVKPAHVLEAINNAHTGTVREGNVGAGTGTICFGFKGGIGTSSRVLKNDLEEYTVGVIVQTNFGGILSINGAPVGKELGQYYMQQDTSNSPDGSCMIVVATNAPVSDRNLKRMAKRAMLGLARTGGISSNGSGDYVIAFSNNKHLRKNGENTRPYQEINVLQNSEMTPLFLATIEATEEAILNSLFAAETMKGYKGRIIEELPVKKVIKLLQEKYNLISK